MKKLKFSLILACVCTALFVADARAQQQPVVLQLGFLLDGSGSISTDNFQTMIDAFVDALSNRGELPFNGMVEVTFVQFSDQSASVVVPPTVLNETNLPTIVSQLSGLSPGGGGTPLWDGIDLLADQMVNSPNFATAVRQVLNVASDGQPQIPVLGIGVTEGNQLSLTARDRAVNLGIDEVDAEALGQGFSNIEFQSFLLDLAWPQPGVLLENPEDFITNFEPGFLALVTTFEELDEVLLSKLRALTDFVNIGPGGGGDGDRDGRDGIPIPFDSPLSLTALILLFGLLLLFRMRQANVR